MIFRIVKFLCKLLGKAYITEKYKEKLSIFTEEIHETIKTKMQKIGLYFLLICVVFGLASLGLRFLLFGMAYWLNHLLSSTYAGFFIIAFVCFLSIAIIILIMRKKITHSIIQEKKIDIQ